MSNNGYEDLYQHCWSNSPQCSSNDKYFQHSLLIIGSITRCININILRINKSVLQWSFSEEKVFPIHQSLLCGIRSAQWAKMPWSYFSKGGWLAVFLSYFLLWICYETQIQTSKWAKPVGWVGQLTRSPAYWYVREQFPKQILPAKNMLREQKFRSHVIWTFSQRHLAAPERWTCREQFLRE